MLKKLTLPALLLTVFCSYSFAQLPTMDKETAEKMEWLEQFVGEWEVTSEGTAGPGQPTMKYEGSMKTKMLGKHWVVSEVQVDMPGMNVNALQTLGYDSESKKYVGTWVDSMMGHMWHYKGTVDESGKKLALQAEGPDMTQPGKTKMYQDAYEFKDKDTISFTSSMKGPDGKWITFMTGEYKRKK